MVRIQSMVRYCINIFHDHLKWTSLNQQRFLKFTHVQFKFRSSFCNNKVLSNFLESHLQDLLAKLAFQCAYSLNLDRLVFEYMESIFSQHIIQVYILACWPISVFPALQLVSIFLSCFGFTQQLLLFKKQRSTGSFSIFLTAVIIIASILKINFWFISPFKTAIFIQMFILIALHLLITKEYVGINGHKVDPKRGFVKNFWRWQSFSHYLFFLAVFGLFLGAITYVSILQENLLMGEIYGILATLCQISLAFPQIFNIWRSKSAKGVSQSMILIWVCSDVYKTIYFITNSQPLQFITTGAIQTITDVVLGTQMWYYRQKPVQVDKKA